MKLLHVLATKGPMVHTCSPAMLVREAVERLRTADVGALVVVDGDRPLGILSERDIVRALARHRDAALSEPVSGHMTTKVVTCTGRSPINELMSLMTEGKFRHIPVVEDGRLAGIVSIGDIVKHRLAEIESEHQALRDYIATA